MKERINLMLVIIRFLKGDVETAYINQLRLSLGVQTSCVSCLSRCHVSSNLLADS